MSTKKRKPRKPSQLDVLRLGSGLAAAKAQTDPKQWAKLVKSAHSRGFTVAGALSDVPDPLKARLRSSLKSQAQSEIDSAYKPVFDNFDAQDSRITAWENKRSADNKAYTDWLLNANAQLNHNTEANIASLHAAGQQASGPTAFAATPPQGSPGAQQQVDDAAARDQGLAQSQSGKNDAVANALQSAHDITKDNTALYGQAMAAKNAGEITQMRNNLLDDRQKATIQKATDFLSRFTQLDSGELTKAQYNIDSSNAAAALGLKQDAFDLSVTKADETTRHNKANESASAQSRTISRAKLAVEKGKGDLNEDGKIDVKDYKLKKQIDAKYGSKSSSKGPKLRTGTRDAAVQIQRIRGGIDPLKALQAKHKAGKLHGGKTIRQRMKEKGYSDDEITLIEQLASPSGLTTGGRRIALNHLFIDPDSLG